MQNEYGAIFDWDGVIIDSSTAHEKSWELLAEEENRELPPGHFKKGFGRKNEVIIPDVLSWTNDESDIKRLGLRKEELYREIIAKDGLNPLPGVQKLLQGLKNTGIPCVVGSSSPLLNIETVLDIIDFRSFFTDIVSGDDVTNGKPNPEVFLKAAQKIDRAPGNCAVFEDAHFGIEAAIAGGMKAIAVCTSHTKDSFTNADLVVDRLNEMTVERFISMFPS